MLLQYYRRMFGIRNHICCCKYFIYKRNQNCGSKTFVFFMIFLLQIVKVLRTLNSKGIDPIINNGKAKGKNN